MNARREPTYHPGRVDPLARVGVQRLPGCRSLSSERRRLTREDAGERGQVAELAQLLRKEVVRRNQEVIARQRDEIASSPGDEHDRSHVANRSYSGGGRFLLAGWGKLPPLRKKQLSGLWCCRRGESSDSARRAHGWRRSATRRRHMRRHIGIVRSDIMTVSPRFFARRLRVQRLKDLFTSGENATKRGT
jgi:hypothetical protein